EDVRPHPLEARPRRRPRARELEDAARPPGRVARGPREVAEGGGGVPVPRPIGISEIARTGASRLDRRPGEPEVATTSARRALARGPWPSPRGSRDGRGRGPTP